MELIIQIKSFVYSFVFGCFFYFLLELFNRFSMKVKLVVKIPISLLFILLVSLLYFLILLYVNNGYVHGYFLLSILVGYMFVYFIVKKWFTHKKKIK